MSLLVTNTRLYFFHRSRCRHGDDKNKIRNNKILKVKILQYTTNLQRWVGKCVCVVSVWYHSTLVVLQQKRLLNPSSPASFKQPFCMGMQKGCLIKVLVFESIWHVTPTSRVRKFTNFWDTICNKRFLNFGSFNRAYSVGRSYRWVGVACWSCMSNLICSLTALHSLAARRAAHISSRGIVAAFNMATLDLDQRRLTVIYVTFRIFKMYAFCDASPKEWSSTDTGSSHWTRLGNAPNNLQRYVRLQQICQLFWRRWQQEDISELQHRHKCNPNVRYLVLLQEDDVPPLCWKLGRISRLFYGPTDHVARVADVTTRGECVRRALSRLCPTSEELEGWKAMFWRWRGC